MAATNKSKEQAANKAAAGKPADNVAEIKPVESVPAGQAVESNAVAQESVETPSSAAAELAAQEATDKAAAAAADAAAIAARQAEIDNTEEGVYRNVSTVNLFTEVGRVAPTKLCKLTSKQAAQYKGLELCS